MTKKTTAAVIAVPSHLKPRLISKKERRAAIAQYAPKARFWFAIVQADDFKIEKGEDNLSDYTWIPPGKSKANLHYRFARPVVSAYLHRETRNHSVNSTQCLSRRWTISGRTPTKSPSR
jgi:hypothetical protein